MSNEEQQQVESLLRTLSIYRKRMQDSKVVVTWSRTCGCLQSISDTDAEVILAIGETLGRKVALLTSIIASQDAEIMMLRGRLRDKEEADSNNEHFRRNSK